MPNQLESNRGQINSRIVNYFMKFGTFQKKIGVIICLDQQGCLPEGRYLVTKTVENINILKYVKIFILF